MRRNWHHDHPRAAADDIGGSSLHVGVTDQDSVTAAMLTLEYAQALPGIHVVAACPGLTDTDVAAGFPGAAPVSDAVQVIVDLATSGGQETGTVVEASGPLPW